MGIESTVVFGLASAATWGAADFGGGLASRRAPVFAVSAIVQGTGILVAAALALAAAEPWPDRETLLIAAAAGVFGGTGILALYQGLAVGRIGVVAPVTGVLAATLPVLIGMIRDGLPGDPVLLGIGLALVAVVLVSRAPGVAGTRSGIEFAVAAGVAIGAFNVVIAQVPPGHVFWPLTAAKTAATIAILVMIGVGRRPWRMARPVLPSVGAVGCLDLGGNGFYLLAVQAGRLDVAATLSSLYPVTTVVLAAVLLRERMSRTHLAGILAAAVAIGLIASGTAAG